MLGTAALLFPVATPSARAANFEVLRLPGYDNVIIMMTGEVIEGDAQRFNDAVATLGGAHATVNVSGPGGLVDEALDIGSQVQDYRFATMVSAQTYARWVEAEQRLKESPALYKTPSGYVQQSPWLNIVNKQLELMGRYMTELGMTPAARSRVAALDPRMQMPDITFRTIYEEEPRTLQVAFVSPEAKG